MTQREQALQGYIVQLKEQIRLMHSTHMMLLTAIVHYCGGELTLREEDHTVIKGLMLTEQVDPVAKLRTFRTRRVNRDGVDELNEVARGGLLPPDAGQHNGGTDVNN